MNKKSSFTLLVLLFALQVAFSQSFYSSSRRMRNTLIVNLGLNTSTYYGDLKPDNDYIDFKPSLSLGASYYFNDRFGARAEFSWITLSASDSKSGEEGKVLRNLSFKSSNFEFATVGIVNLFNNTYSYQRPKFNPYGFAGIGFMHFNPKAEYNGEVYKLHPLMTEGVDYSRVTLVLPYGLGVKYFVAPFLNVNLEVGWRKTFSDYLDDVSTVYLDNNTIVDPLAKSLADRRPEIGLPVLPEGSKRGDSSNDDGYMLVSIKCEYYLQNLFESRKLYTVKRKKYRRR